MTSAMKDKLSRVTGLSSSTETSAEDASSQKYMLKVTAGVSYKDSTRNTVVVNGDDCIINDHCKVAVRIHEYQGIPGESVSHSSYFEDPTRIKDTYSIAFSWAPEEDVSAEDLVWGIELVNPIGDRIPKRFITTAFDVCKRFVDSSLICDPYVDQPWVNGAILCGSAMTFWIGGRQKQVATPASVLTEGGDEEGESIRQDYGIPSDEGKRRKFFGNETKRKEFMFEKGRCYQFDFHNGYIDWKGYALKLPGFSLSVLKWINDRTHTVRFAMKNRKTGQQYLVVTFRLLFGDQLEKALADDGECSQTGQRQGDDATDKVEAVAGVGAETQARDHAESNESKNDPPTHLATPEPAAAASEVEGPEVDWNSWPGQESTTSQAHAGLENGRSEPEVMPYQSNAGSERKASEPEPPASQTVGSLYGASKHDDYMPEKTGQSQANDQASPAETGEQTAESFSLQDLTLSGNAVRSQSQDTSTTNGYRHSIEESLCQTATTDGRNKLSSVLQ